MKIVTWNCQGKFREKFELIMEENADIYVIQECENPEKTDNDKYKEFAEKNFFWVGDVHYKGLGIFANNGSNVSFEQIEGLEERFKNFIALRVNDSFNLLGVWAMDEDKKLGLNKYVQMIHDYFDANYEKLFDENLIMCGDFNSNVVWNHEHRKKDNYNNDKNQTFLNIKLNNKGLYSAYHDLTGEEQGEESKATFYLQNNLEKPYHIDYVYAKKGRITKFEILDSEKWIKHSDHMPIVFEFD